MKRSVPALVAALFPILSGCATQMGGGGSLGSREPAFCAVSFAGTGGMLTQRLLKDPTGRATGLRSFRALAREDFSAAGCDVLLRVQEDVFDGAGSDPASRGRGAGIDCTLTAYSAHTRAWLWRGMSSANSCDRLVDKLLEGLGQGDRRIGAGGPELTLQAVEALAGRVRTRAELAALAAAEPEIPLVATVDGGRGRTAPAPAPAQTAAPVSAPAAARASSDVDDVPAPRAARKGHAVIVGIERYRGKLPPADYAAADAALMAKYAAAVLGYPEENIALLTNDGASKSDFEKHFERWLSNRVEKDDEVFVYFSGHGAPNPQTGDAYLVPYDGDPMYLAETGYPIKRMYEALSKLPAKKVTVALDSCFSGAGGRSVIAKGARPLVTVQAVEAPANVTVISASSGEQISNSFDEKGHGLFTYFFLKGLKENGSDLKAAFDFAKPEVAKVARRQFNADQEPQWGEGR